MAAFSQKVNTQIPSYNCFKFRKQVVSVLSEEFWKHVKTIDLGTKKATRSGVFFLLVEKMTIFSSSFFLSKVRVIFVVKTERRNMKKNLVEGKMMTIEFIILQEAQIEEPYKFRFRRNRIVCHHV